MPKTVPPAYELTDAEKHHLLVIPGPPQAEPGIQPLPERS